MIKLDLGIKQITVLLLFFLVTGCTTEEYCTDYSGNSLSLTEAEIIATNSECVQGNLLKNHFCNENTGTWWIDLDLEQEGCAPACVVDVAEKTAEINWRCTGLVQK